MLTKSWNGWLGGTSRKSTDTSWLASAEAQLRSSTETRTFIVVPGSPEVKVIVSVDSPPVIVPPSSAQVGTRLGSSGIEATRPGVCDGTETGAEISGVGSGQESTVVVSLEMLFERFGSASSAVTVAVFVMERLRRGRRG